MSPNRLEAPTRLNNVETGNAHICHICHAREPEADDNDEIAEQENGALEIIALTLAIHVAEQEDAQNDSDHVPLGENKAKSVVVEVFWAKPLSINGAEQYQSRNLKQANLEGIRGSNLHG